MKAGVFLEARDDSGQTEVGRCQHFSRELKEGARQPKTGREDITLDGQTEGAGEGAHLSESAVMHRFSILSRRGKKKFLKSVPCCCGR